MQGEKKPEAACEESLDKCFFTFSMYCVLYPLRLIQDYEKTIKDL